MEEADQRAPERLADDESAGSVDWVDDPAEFGARLQGSKLLAHHPMRRVSLREQLPDRPFGGKVGGGDWIKGGTALVVDLGVSAEMRQYDRTRPIGEIMRQSQEISDLGADRQAKLSLKIK
jgi:hypothetical protein